MVPDFYQSAARQARRPRAADRPVAGGRDPYLAAAFLVERYAGDALRSPLIVGNALVWFGLLLYGADKLGLTVRLIEHMTFGQALTIGLIQCCAVIPGAGATGIAMTTGRLFGFERPDAVRFAFLLAIPIRRGGRYKGLAAVQAGSGHRLSCRRDRHAACRLVAGIIALALHRYWVRRAGFAPFVLYRVAVRKSTCSICSIVAGGPRRLVGSGRRK